jgi:hypothetical protein
MTTEAQALNDEDERLNERPVRGIPRFHCAKFCRSRAACSSNILHEPSYSTCVCKNLKLEAAAVPWKRHTLPKMAYKTLNMHRDVVRSLAAPFWNLFSSNE